MTNEEALKVLKYRSGWNLSIRDVNALDMAIKALEQESESICKYGVLHKIAEFFQNWNGDETAKMEISVNDMREIADVYGRKARIERQLKEKALEQQPCEDAISREEAIGAVANLFEMSEYPHPYSQGKPIRLREIKEKLKQLPSVQPKITNKSEKLIGSNDCIDRAQAQTEIEMHACRYTIAKERDGMGQVEWSDQLIKVSDAVDIIRHLSSVTPQEQKTGQWILLDECSNSGYYCSECHKKLVKEGWSGTVKKIKFCPNCGVKMVDVSDINDGKLSKMPTGSECEGKE